MKFLIEYGEVSFRVVAPNGEFEEAVSYCAVSTVEYEGRVYGAYLNGGEEEKPSPDAANTLVPSSTAQVYDLSDWPAIEPVETISENVDFEDEVAN